MLLDASSPDGDAALARALGLRPTAIAAAAVFADARQAVTAADGRAAVATARRPIAFCCRCPRFAEHAAIGVVNVATDQSGTPRAFPMLFRGSERVEMSLTLRAAALASGADPIIEPDGIRIADRLIPTDIDHRLPLAFYGRRGTIRTISAADSLPADAIAGRIVVIGATVTGGGDFFPTPFDPVMPGVEVVATAINHLMTGDGLRRDRNVRRVDALLALALADAAGGAAGLASQRGRTDRQRRRAAGSGSAAIGWRSRTAC